MPRKMHALRSITCLMAILMVPSIPQYLFGASSMTAGLAVAAGLSVLLWKGSRFRFDMPVKAQCLALLFVIVHTAPLLASAAFDRGRFAASFALLVYLVVAAFAASSTIFNARHRLDRPLYGLFILMNLIAALGVAGWVPTPASNFPKAVFPYTEPSHFALSYLPLLMMVSIRSKGWLRYLSIACGIAAGYLLQNLVLIVGSTLVLLVCSRTLTLVSILAVMSVAASGLDLEYFTNRLDFSGEIQNVSNLVYVQGWQLIEESLLRSQGYGLGFQQLGLTGTDVPAADLIFAILAEHINLNDGGFTLAKLVSEFGAFGILAAAWYGFLWLRSALTLRLAAMARQPLPASMALAHCFVVCYVFELMLRGVGYFSGTGLLMLASLIAIHRHKRRELARRRSLRRPASAGPAPLIGAPAPT